MASLTYCFAYCRHGGCGRGGCVSGIPGLRLGGWSWRWCLLPRHHRSPTSSISASQHRWVAGPVGMPAAPTIFGAQLVGDGFFAFVIAVTIISFAVLGTSSPRPMVTPSWSGTEPDPGRHLRHLRVGEVVGLRGGGHPGRHRRRALRLPVLVIFAVFLRLRPGLHHPHRIGGGWLAVRLRSHLRGGCPPARPRADRLVRNYSLIVYGASWSWSAWCSPKACRPDSSGRAERGPPPGLVARHGARRGGGSSVRPTPPFGPPVTTRSDYRPLAGKVLTLTNLRKDFGGVPQSTTSR